jgi:hypothetical protein
MERVKILTNLSLYVEQLDFECIKLFGILKFLIQEEKDQFIIERYYKELHQKLVEFELLKKEIFNIYQINPKYYIFDYSNNEIIYSEKKENLC